MINVSYNGLDVLQLVAKLPMKELMIVKHEWHQL